MFPRIRSAFLICILIVALGGIFQTIVASSPKAPQNIILLISDGCGYYHVDAASIYQYGQTGTQVYEQFPVRYAMCTYSGDGDGYDPEIAWTWFDYVKQKPTDSAAAATTMATRFKTYDAAIGVDMNQEPLENIVERAEKLGKATGVITSVEFSHATPAGFVAHNISRDHYTEIAQEMIGSSTVDVIMGTGHPHFNNDGRRVNTPHFRSVGETIWQDLVAGIAGNDADGDGVADPWTLIEDRSEFLALMSGPTPKRVLGIPKVFRTLQIARDGDLAAAPYVVPLTETVPTLAEMTAAGLNVLDNDPDGFFLMVEGGAVDWAGHYNLSGRMIEEQIDFNQSVEVVVDWVDAHSSWDETLVMVTGDHECGYLTGPGSGPDRHDPESGVEAVWNPLGNNGQGHLPGMEWHNTEHTNALIPLYAKGSGSELFESYADELDPVRGNFIDNTEIGIVLFSLWTETTGLESFTLVHGVPKDFSLAQNYPNPFNPTTTIAYDLPKASDVTLTIYTIMGQEVAVLVDAYQEAGHHRAMLDGSGYANGVYLYRLEAGSFVETKRMALVK